MTSSDVVAMTWLFIPSRFAYLPGLLILSCYSQYSSQPCPVSVLLNLDFIRRWRLVVLFVFSRKESGWQRDWNFAYLLERGGKLSLVLAPWLLMSLLAYWLLCPYPTLKVNKQHFLLPQRSDEDYLIWSYNFLKRLLDALCFRANCALLCVCIGIQWACTGPEQNVAVQHCWI